MVCYSTFYRRCFNLFAFVPVRSHDHTEVTSNGARREIEDLPHAQRDARKKARGLVTGVARALPYDSFEGLVDDLVWTRHHGDARNTLPFVDKLRFGRFELCPYFTATWLSCDYQ